VEAPQSPVLIVALAAL